MSNAGVPCPDSLPKPAPGPMSAGEAVALMLVRLGGRWFALPARMVQEVAVKGAVTRVPTAARHVLGVASLRGELVPVISLEQMIGVGGPALPDSATTLPRLVVVRAGEYDVAIVVDEICVIIEDRLPALTVKTGIAGRPSFMREEFEWQGNRVCALDVALLVAAAAGRSQGGD